MKTTSVLLALAFCCMIASSVIAQSRTLHIIVKDDNNMTFQNATAVLYSLPDSTLQSKSVIKGDAHLNVNIDSDYFIQISASGFKTETRQFHIKDSSISIIIKLTAVVSSLGNVTIISKKPLIRQEDDKTIVDAEVLANSSTNAFEVLEKTPGAVVDQDGNVYLSSTSPATIFINGREMKLSSADIASLLKSLPSGSVSKIEILRNPSAKFDAASNGGIINIVLKKGVKLGTSGSANIAYFQGVYSTKTAGLSLNKSAGKLNSYLSYQFTSRNNFEELNSDRLAPTDSLLTQRAYTTYPYLNNYLGGGLDYAITKKLNIAYDARLSLTNGESIATNPISINNEKTNELFEKNRSDINNINQTFYWGNNVSAKYKIDSVGSEWITQIDYTYYKYTNDQIYSNYYLLPQRSTIKGNGTNENYKNIFVAQSDITLKLPSKYSLEAGLKISVSNSNNGSLFFKDTGNSILVKDIYQTNTFRFKELVSAAYVQVAKTFGGLTVKPGLRLETTNIQGRQLIPSDTTFTIKRNDIFSYIYLKHNLFKIFGTTLVGNAIYRRSIKRPFYEALNPFPRFIDQYLFDVGNPNLRPQFTTNYEFNVSFQEFPVAAIGVNDTRDIFSNVTYQDDATKIAYRTYDNLGRNKEFYVKLIGGIPPGGKYFFYAGAQYNFNRYTGFYQNLPFNYTRGSYVFFMFHEYKATKTFTVNLQGFMRTKGLQNLYELNTFGGLFISVNKSILKKKANIIVSLNDALRTNKVAFSLEQGNVKAEGIRINDTRRLGVTVRYNFGSKKKEEKKQSFEAPADLN